MLQIRNKVFETNSSSSHSIVVMKERPEPNTWYDWYFQKERLRFYEDELIFGRAPFDILDNWHGRLRYALASFAYDEDKREYIGEIMRQCLPNFKDFEFPRSICYNEETDSHDYETFYGEVDHQSAGLLQNFLETHNVSLKDFIFDDRYIVIIDGDEYHVFDKIQHMTSWNKDAVEDIYD